MGNTRRPNRAGLVLGLCILVAIGGAGLYVYGTTRDYAWFAYGPPFDVPPPRPLSLQVLRVVGAALAALGIVGVVIATRRLVRSLAVTP